jgi:hypothetical protein
MKPVTLLSLLLLLVIALPGSVGLANVPYQGDGVSLAAQLYVATDGNDIGDCRTVGGRCRTIQYALNHASPGDEIRVAGGVYKVSGTVAAITQAVRITGGYDPAFAGPDPDLYETVLDASWGGSVVHIEEAGSVALQHLTLIHGDGSSNCENGYGCGGGIYAYRTELFMQHCLIKDNVANSIGSVMGSGGGVYVYSSDHEVHILNSEIAYNFANASSSATNYSYGGGLFVRNGMIVMVGNHIHDNDGSSAGAGGNGGGIYFYQVKNAYLEKNLLENNKAATTTESGGSGGGLYSFFSTIELQSNRIAENWTNPNVAGSGGGILLVQSETVMNGNTITGNSSLPPNSGWSAPGGGVYIGLGKSLVMTNNLVAQNKASNGGGLYIQGSDTMTTTVTLTNNTIAENRYEGMNIEGIMLDSYASAVLVNNVITGHAVGVKTYNLQGTLSANTNLFWNEDDPFTGTNPILTDPLLTGTFRQRPGSPVIDSGLPIAGLTTDIEGNPRPQGGGFDLGAFEGTLANVFLPILKR